MTFLETLRARKGSLIRLKIDLYWYGGRGFDGIADRICMVLDACSEGASYQPTDASVNPNGDGPWYDVTTQLLIDGRPFWVWVKEADMEFL